MNFLLCPFSVLKQKKSLFLKIKENFPHSKISTPAEDAF